MIDRRSLSTVLFLLAPLPALGQTFTPQAFVALRAGAVEARRSWLAGGDGKLLGGDEQDRGERRETAAGELRLGLDWTPSPVWLVRVHLGGRQEPDEGPARAAGIVEAFAQRQWAARDNLEVHARAGLFFLPTSRESTGPLWTSPYTLTLSAWNSWIAEEVRPLGLDLGTTVYTAAEWRLSAAATVFGGNDTSGVLLAWRGFALHDRPVVLGSFLPVPPLASLDGIFATQTRRGTRPLGDDLDGRPGWSARARVQAPDERFLVQLTAYDNRGDRVLHGDQYAWRTRFLHLGVQGDLGGGWMVAGEWGRGDTSMGPSAEALGKPFNVFADFAAGYLLASWEHGPWRISGRYDRFEVVDRDHAPRAEDNDEDGHAWTLAALCTLRERWRLGVEVLDLTARRDEVGMGGQPANEDGRSLRVEVRWSY